MQNIKEKIVEVSQKCIMMGLLRQRVATLVITIEKLKGLQLPQARLHTMN